MFKLRSILLLCIITHAAYSSAPPIVADTHPVSISVDELNLSHSNNATQQLLKQAIELAGKNLIYKYGSADPINGGMDCSGTVYYLVRSSKINEIPRSSDQMYQWVWQKGHFYPVNAHTLDSFEFSHLKAGDLLFWSGTYETGNRDPNVSHVMIYLGKNKANKMLMIGASNGRTYQGRKIHGVSVFDFNLPDATSKSRFLGYSCIPNLNC